jgi:isocitrate dehydrogenase (NAD+)
MVTEGRAKYADPASMMRASAMLLGHIGFKQESERLDRALDICILQEKKISITGRDTGATCEAFTRYVKDTLER